MKIDFHQEVSPLRAKGWRMIDAWQTAKVNVTFQILADAGLVRLVVEVDETLYDDSYIDDLPKRERDALRKELWQQIEREDVWGLVGAYRITTDDTWIPADSIWGFIGHGWCDSGYDTDIRKSAMQARDRLIQEIADKMADRPTYASL